MRWRLACLALVALCAALAVALGAQRLESDGLVRVPSLDYVNDYPSYGFKIVCTNRGTRADFKADGSDVRVGDRIVRDCKVVSR